MNPLFIGAIVGHFVRDFLPSGLLPSLGGPAAQNPNPQAEAAADEFVPPVPRAPLGPIPLDEGISEPYERAVWAAYRDPNAQPEHLMGFSQALETEGMPISAGILRARVLELGRLREAQRIQAQIAAQRAARAAQTVAAQTVAAPAPVVATEVRPTNVRAGEDEQVPTGMRGTSVPAGQEGPFENASPVAPPKKQKTGPRVRVTAPEPLTNGHNGETMLPPEEEEETPPAAARA